MIDWPPELWHFLAYQSGVLSPSDVLNLVLASSRVANVLTSDQYGQDQFFSLMGALWCVKRRLWTATRYAIQRTGKVGRDVSYCVFVNKSTCDNAKWFRLLRCIVKHPDATLEFKGRHAVSFCVENGHPEAVTLFKDVEVTHEMLFSAIFSKNVELVETFLKQLGDLDQETAQKAFSFAIEADSVPIFCLFLPYCTSVTANKVYKLSLSFKSPCVLRYCLDTMPVNTNAYVWLSWVCTMYRHTNAECLKIVLEHPAMDCFDNVRACRLIRTIMAGVCSKEKKYDYCKAILDSGRVDVTTDLKRFATPRRGMKRGKLERLFYNFPFLDSS
ncbi:MAG: hypothetical protein CMP20_04520 [Rickettsiales bacterium]|nr:hypothetical protein [Rickettsiales bacterium]